MLEDRLRIYSESRPPDTCLRDNICELSAFLKSTHHALKFHVGWQFRCLTCAWACSAVAAARWLAG